MYAKISILKRYVFIKEVRGRKRSGIEYVRDFFCNHKKEQFGESLNMVLWKKGVYITLSGNVI